MKVDKQDARRLVLVLINDTPNRLFRESLSWEYSQP